MPSPEALDLNALRLRLAERAQALRQELRHDRAKLADDVADDSAVFDRKDQAGLMTQTSVDDAEFTRDLEELAAVEAALQRLNAGRFGICQDCAEPMAADRLEAQPWASRCVSCQARFERQAP